MHKRFSILLALAALASGRDVAAATTHWSVVGTPARVTVTGGPWVLAQGTAAFPTDNPGNNPMQPYYHAFTVGDATHMTGYFDYRPKNVAEAVVAATSTDGGRTWVNPVKKLYFVGDSTTQDNGEGHPFIMTVAGHTYLYTLDRAAGNVDSAGLFVREITAGGALLAGVPDSAAPGSTTVTRTSGLVDPDGIIAVVPGSTNPTSILYLSKDTTLSPQVTKMILVDTTDGVTFTNPREAVGLNDPATTTGTEWIGPRGSLIAYGDGRYGLFFSGGVSADADADAFHYIGYAESTDLVSWTVVNGLDQPLLSTDAAKDPLQQPWYAGRLYAPSVTLTADGCGATMLFAGYKTVKVSAAPNDYRQMGVVTLAQPCGASSDMATSNVDMAGVAPDDMATAGGGAGGGGGGSDGNGNGNGGSGGSGGGGSNGGHGGCSATPSSERAPAFVLLALIAALMPLRRLARRGDRSSGRGRC